jgi:hypothetical protein
VGGGVTTISESGVGTGVGAVSGKDGAIGVGSGVDVGVGVGTLVRSRGVAVGVAGGAVIRGVAFSVGVGFGVGVGVGRGVGVGVGLGVGLGVGVGVGEGVGGGWTVKVSTARNGHDALPSPQAKTWYVPGATEGISNAARNEPVAVVEVSPRTAPPICCQWILTDVFAGYPEPRATTLAPGLPESGSSLSAGAA